MICYTTLSELSELRRSAECMTQNTLIDKIQDGIDLHKRSRWRKCLATRCSPTQFKHGNRSIHLRLIVFVVCIPAGFHRFPLIFIDFCRFSTIFIDFHGRQNRGGDDGGGIRTDCGISSLSTGRACEYY